MKGAIGELRTSFTLRRAGYDELPSRLPSNNGFDGAWVKRGADGSVTDIIITESKYAPDGVLKLANTKTMGQQLSSNWIDGNIQKMLNSADPSVVRSGMLLDANRHLIRAKGAVLDSSGVLQFSSH